MLISFALVFFLLLGVASAADLSNVSSVESSDDNSEIVSSDITSENDLSFNDDVNELSQGAVSEKTGANNSKSGDVKVEDKKTSLKVVSPSTIIKGNHFLKLYLRKQSPNYHQNFQHLKHCSNPPHWPHPAKGKRQGQKR